MRIALLEDDPAQAELLQTWFDEAGHRTYHYETGQALLHAARAETFDLMVLDWNLPDISGDVVLERLRTELDWSVPVLFITSRESEADIVHALAKGADDYMTKPVKRGEALARIAALDRRAGGHRGPEERLEFGPVTVDLHQRRVTRDGEAVELTNKEYDLLVFLVRNVGRLLSRGHILESVWGTRPDLNTRTVDTHVSRLRNKLGLLPEHGWRLSSVYQHGYRLEAVEQE